MSGSSSSALSNVSEASTPSDGAGSLESNEGTVRKQRYVLQYSIEDIEFGFRLVPLSLNDLREEELCCEMRGNWSDPHLGHSVTVRCAACKEIAINHGVNFQHVQYLKASHSAVDPEDGQRNHLVFKCNNVECRAQTTGTTGKLRILRRGRGALYARGLPIPTLDVEVIGEFIIDCTEDIWGYWFTPYCRDEEDNLFATMENENGQDRRILGADNHTEVGTVEGFKGRWRECVWDSNEHDQWGLRVIDGHNSQREGYPPAHWNSDPENEDEEEVVGEEAEVGGEGQVEGEGEVDGGGEEEEVNGGGEVDGVEEAFVDNDGGGLGEGGENNPVEVNQGVGGAGIVYDHGDEGSQN